MKYVKAVVLVFAFAAVYSVIAEAFIRPELREPIGIGLGFIFGFMIMFT